MNRVTALQAIEILVGEDFGMDMEWILHQKKKVDPRLKQAAKIITMIYQIAHAESLSCQSHDDWKKIKHRILKEYHEKQT